MKFNQGDNSDSRETNGIDQVDEFIYNRYMRNYNCHINTRSKGVRKLFSLTKKTKSLTRTESTVLIFNMSSEGRNVFAERMVKMDEVSRRKGNGTMKNRLDAYLAGFEITMCRKANV